LLLIHPYLEHETLYKLDVTIYFKQRHFKTQVFVQWILRYCDLSDFVFYLKLKLILMTLIF